MEVQGTTIAERRTSSQGTEAALLSLPGLVLIQPKSFGDERGFFLETYHRDRYAEFGITADFVQDNLSFSAHGVQRGLHFQAPGAQAKLVSVVTGAVFDVAVDIRVGSPTFGRWAAVHLTGENHRQFFIPRGFAHGFCVISETAHFSYKCDAYYAPAQEHVIHFQDPDIGIVWPMALPKVSAKDAAGLRLRDFSTERLPQYLEREAWS